MAVVARVAACTAMLGLVACAAIAGLEAPAELEQSTTPPDRPAPDPTTTSSSNPPPGKLPPTDGSTTPGTDAATDVGAKDADAAPPPPPCTKTPNGQACSLSDTCCSNKCNEAKVCAQDCRSLASSCDPFAGAPCCVGLYCMAVGFCGVCIGPGGTPADALLGGKNAKSCCSRMIGGNGACI